MQVVGNYNKISPQLEESIPALEGAAIFEMLNGVPNPEPDATERAKQPQFLYGKTQLKTRFKIKDPHTKKIVEIVVAEGWTNDGHPERAKLFVAGIGETHFGGIFTLQEGNVDHEELFRAFYISPEREGSPCPDAKITPLYRLVNKKAEGQKAININKELKEALELTEKMSVEDATNLMASLNQQFENETELRAAVGELAKADTKKFNKLYKDPNTKIKADVKFALDKGIIHYDHATRTVTLGDTLLTTLAADVEKIEGIASYLAGAKNGKNIVDGIRKQLKEAV